MILYFNKEEGTDIKNNYIYAILFISLFTVSVFILNSNGIHLNEMFIEVHWSALIPASFIMASVPGANQILSLRNGLRKGAKVAIMAVSGRFTAFTLMVIAVSLGLSAILQTSTLVFQIIKWVGVFYLGWLGVKTILSSRKEYEDVEKQPTDSQSAADVTNAWQLAKQEFMVATANPKALLLFTVFLPQFINAEGGGIGGQILIVGGVYILIEFTCATIYAIIGGKMRTIGLSGKAKRYLDRITGGIMIGLAIWLSTEKK